MNIIIPMKGFSHAKSRLTNLSPEQRKILARRWFEHTLRTAVSLEEAEIYVLTSSQEVSSLAQRHGAYIVREPDNHNGFRDLLQRTCNLFPPSETIGILMGDLPLLKRRELRLACSLIHHSDAMIAPDLQYGGTNFLLLQNNNPAALRFGAVDSYQQHLHALRSANLTPHTVMTAGLSTDIDTPKDLKVLSRSTTTME